MKTWRKNVQNALDKLSVPVLAAFLLSFLGLMGEAQATSLCREEAAFIVSLQGIVELRRANEVQWQQAGMDTILCAGDSIRVRTNSRAALRLRNDGMLRLDQKTSLTFPPAQTEPGKSLLDLFEGAIHIITRTPKPFKVRTPFVNASVDGTEFYVGLEQDTAKVVVYEGKVTASNELGSVALSDHEAAIATRDQAPRKEIIVRPADAVHWALYYPAIADYVHGDIAAASDVLRQTGRLLMTGQADEAQQLLMQTLKVEPNDGDVHALLAIIAVVQNEKAQALEYATRAVSLNPRSATALLAQSYVQQAHFDIEAALGSVQQALEHNAQQALTWARLAELQMSLGQLDHALEAAQQAVKLQPELAKTQTMLGFARLLQIDTRTAKEIFQRAIVLDQADPMPRLGLGIALIREGELEQGRIELEIAASLDPANSLIRSYLGKAYFEEKRYPLASTQFDLAKERDPKDPTPWFYDAIQKQTQNRPVEALRDIQKSIELNDNRAVYRSRFLLDRDEAARGSSLARIFENLGFERRAVMETAKSLSFDPANHSAHRFLSDTYANTPRHEIARVSELLQAQLLQPINVNPVQPHLAVADLNIISGTGPSAAGFNEFTPLMERSKPQLVASGIVGSNGILGNEVVLSKLYERTSISFGQFHHETNGFRSNNDQKHNIYNAFVQHAVNSKLNVQAELRMYEKEHGDLLFDFDRRIFSENNRQKLNEKTARVGMSYKFSPQQDFIVSAIYTHRNGDVTVQNQIIDPLMIDNQINNNYQIEAQHLFRQNYFNIITGGGIVRTNIRDDFSKSGDTCFLLLLSGIDCSKPNKANREQNNAYLYSNWFVHKNIVATLGFSYSSYEEEQDSRRKGFSEFDPKIGLQVNINENLRLRLAWFETLKRDLNTQRTIEPTQVAGFNQFYDDPNGTRSQRKGIGFDIRVLDNVFGGVEVSERILKPPFNISGIDLQNERLARAYLYATLNPHWSIVFEPQFEKLDREIKVENRNEPNKLNTFSAPVSINYFNQNGIFAKLTGSYISQKIDRPHNPPLLNLAYKDMGISNFFLLDLLIGHRFYNRRGLLSLEIRNLLDTEFFYRNQHFYVSEPIAPRYIPERTFLGKLTFNF